MAEFVTRFAPSPTGRLHLGHAYSAWLVRRMADAAGGTALLRIEDVDAARCKPEYEAGLLEDLAWLGLRFDGPFRRQSDHFEDYARVVEALRVRGLVYRSFHSRQEIEAETGGAPDAPFVSEPLPPEEEAVKLDRGEAFAWRLSLARAREALGAAYDGLGFTVEGDDGRRQVRAEPDRFGDVALKRKDAPAAYHLAACHDDAAQGVTHVIRGEDLIDAPHIHTLLQTLMGWPHPVYRHHPLLTGPDGKRFAKRDRSRTLAAMREAGMTPDEVLALAGAA